MSSRRAARRRAVLMGLSFALHRGDASAQAAPNARPTARPASWAQPLPQAGVKNLHRITPTLYRSAQPRRADVAALHKLGIRTVVSLRSFNGDDSIFRGSGMQLVRIPINTWSIDDDEVTRALRALREAQKNGPVLLHCLHGADRTGVVSALYRMSEQGWSLDDARREMFDGGYGYHTMWRNIPTYLRKVDPVQIRQALDAPPPPPRTGPEARPVAME